LAEELRINRNTIAKAYTELESQGSHRDNPGKGCFLSSNQSPLRKEVRRKLLTEEIDSSRSFRRTIFKCPRPKFVEIVHERLEVFDDRKKAHQENAEVQSAAK